MQDKDRNPTALAEALGSSVPEQTPEGPQPDSSLKSNGEFRRKLPDVEWIERRAKLFESGEYSDKGVTITPEQLTHLADNFRGPVPVLIEHSQSPLELGFLTRVEALGGELFGTISLSKEANVLVEKQGARSLSLGLSPDLTEIREVSLVRKPRVADARLFSGVRFFGNLDADRNDPASAIESSTSANSSQTPTVVEDEPSRWRRRYEDLRAELRREEAERKVEEFVREGRMVPAQTAFATALLQAEDTIEFDGESLPLRQLLIAMIERQPPLRLFAAIAPEADGRAADSALLLPEEAEFYRKYFPEVSLDEIAARKSGRRAQ